MTTSKTLRLTLGLLLLGLAACGGGSSSTAASDDSTASSSEGGETVEHSPEVLAACTHEMQRERECTTDFIPALITLRARLDHPAGFAARDAADHAGIVTRAEQEWSTDTTDERIAATCRDVARLPAEETAGYATTESECLAAADCAAFVACDIRFTETRFRARMAAEGEHPADAATTPTP